MELFPKLQANISTGVSKVTINALYREPDIEVNVPSAGQMYLNPKSLPMVVDGKVENKQIINTPWSIENQSEVAISVNAKIYATINRLLTQELTFRPWTGTSPCMTAMCSC